MQRHLEIDRTAFSNAFGREPLALGHGLRSHKLFSVEALAQLAERLAEDLVEHNVGDLPTIVSNGDVQSVDLPPGDIARGIETNGCWMVLKNVERDPAYRRLLDERLDQVSELIGSREGGMAQREGFAIARETAFVLSDPNAGSPLAYHGLSLGVYARCLDLLGASASGAARETLRQVAHCSWAIAAPDGDLAYFGRSQEQAWSPALTAYGALSAAAIAPPAAAQRLRGLAARAVERLRRAHGTGPKGCFITPSLRPDYRGTHGLDSYAAAIGYSGLTLTAFNWAIDRFGDRVPDAADDAPPSRRATYHFRTASPRNEFTVVRAGHWFAVKSAASARAQDLRYDFGLVALKVRDDAGEWRDVLPPRPKTKVGPDSAGPVLRRSRGVGLPEAESVSVERDGTLTLEGGFRTVSGQWLRRGVRFRFQPLDTGVRLIFPTEPGDRIKYSVFFRDHGDQPQVQDDRVFDDEQLVTFDPPAEVALDSEPYASGTDARLVRANIFFPESGGGAVRITVGPL